MSAGISNELEQFIDQAVACGKYRSRDEVIADGLRLLRERERRRDSLVAELQAGVDELDRGEGIAGETVIGELRRRATEIERNAS